jgi:tRNA-Thr(GGU) m(6)t(6)A37 methyltransferase TsaA
MKIIAHIENDFEEKFGIPRQSGIVDSTQAMIIMEPEYRNPHAFKGIEGYSHLWLLWQFSENIRQSWSPTVLPPRLGGKTHMGVFATRSPFRPNPIGLSSVRLVRYEVTDKFGPVLYVAGADLMNHTPIYDIKPYLAYTDSHPEALAGFAGEIGEYRLKVEIPEELLKLLPENKIETIRNVLAEDPRPSYQNDPDRRYGMMFGGFDIRFHVEGDCLRVCEVVRKQDL